MTTRLSSTLSRRRFASKPILLTGASSRILDDLQIGETVKGVVYVIEIEEGTVGKTATVNSNKLTVNNSSSLLRNNSYYRFSSVRPTVIYSLKKR